MAEKKLEVIAVVELEQEKLTPGAVRYQETGDRSAHIIGTQYLRKDKLTQPFPKKLRVTIERLE